ncbi:hypothetical protein ACE41O_12600 [Alteromonas macleodii]
MMRKQPKERLKKAAKLMKKPAGKFEPIQLSLAPNVPSWMTRAFSNNRYTVMIDDNCIMSDGKPAIKAMVQRHDDAIFPNHWAEMQRIKNEIFGLESVAVQYFPATSNLIDRFNIYWMFIFEEGRIPIYKEEC